MEKNFGKFRIIEEIGRGGFSVVYKAADTTLAGRLVALKVLHGHLLVDPTFIERFNQEAGAAANLNHPNIVTIYEIGEWQGQWYIAMELLDGQSLADIQTDEAPLLPERALRILSGTASALDYAHSRELVHRDVKPGNVIISDSDHATLTDFGLVRAAEGTMLTTTGQFLGTPVYMSPELARMEEDQDVDYHTDLYSLGVVAFEMLTGRPPFTGKTPPAVLHKVIYEPPPSPSSLNSAISPHMEAVLLKMLAKAPQERYQNGASFVAALEGAIAEVESEKKQKQELLRKAEAAQANDDWEALKETVAKLEDLDEQAAEPFITALTKHEEKRKRQQRLREQYEEAKQVVSSDPQRALDEIELIRDQEPGYPNLAELEAQAKRALRRQEDKEQEPGAGNNKHKQRGRQSSWITSTLALGPLGLLIVALELGWLLPKQALFTPFDHRQIALGVLGAWLVIGMLGGKRVTSLVTSIAIGLIGALAGGLAASLTRSEKVLLPGLFDSSSLWIIFAIASVIFIVELIAARLGGLGDKATLAGHTAYAASVGTGIGTTTILTSQMATATSSWTRARLTDTAITPIAGGIAILTASLAVIIALILVFLFLAILGFAMQSSESGSGTGQVMGLSLGIALSTLIAVFIIVVSSKDLVVVCSVMGILGSLLAWGLEAG